MRFLSLLVVTAITGAALLAGPARAEEVAPPPPPPLLDDVDDADADGDADGLREDPAETPAAPPPPMPPPPPVKKKKKPAPPPADPSPPADSSSTPTVVRTEWGIRGNAGAGALVGAVGGFVGAAAGAALLFIPDEQAPKEATLLVALSAPAFASLVSGLLVVALVLPRPVPADYGEVVVCSAVGCAATWIVLAMALGAGGGSGCGSSMQCCDVAEGGQGRGIPAAASTGIGSLAGVAIGALAGFAIAPNDPELTTVKLGVAAGMVGGAVLGGIVGGAIVGSSDW